MAQTLAKAGTRLHVAKVVRHGEQLLIPEGMSIDSAIGLLQRRKEYDEQQVQFVEMFAAFPWDGAHALWQVMHEKYGWASGEAVRTFFGTELPQMITVETGPKSQVEVPWGRITIPGIDGWIDLQYGQVRGHSCFQAAVTTRRKHEPDVRALFAAVREYLKTGSIYKGQAIKVRFREEDGEPLTLPEPKFMDTSGIEEADLIFSASVADAISTNLFTPIRRMEDCKAAGIPVKRGVLLAGRFGVGKTMAARVAAAEAVAAGVTYIYCQRADEFADAVEFAQQYQPAVVFCEDIDRALAGERSTAMDEVLNIIDGIDSKQADIMVVLTTNDVDRINPAMLRPGRLDAVIPITEPDAAAVERLLRHYGAGVLDPDVDLTQVGEQLAGNIPAVIAEVVKRSKLAALKRTPSGTTRITVNAQALKEAAETMTMQLGLLNRKPDAELHPLAPIVEYIQKGFSDGLGSMVEKRMMKALEESGLI